MGIDVACSALCQAHSRCFLDICSQREEEGHTGSGSLRTVCGWEGSETGKVGSWLEGYLNNPARSSRGKGMYGHSERPLRKAVWTRCSYQVDHRAQYP